MFWGTSVVLTTNENSLYVPLLRPVNHILPCTIFQPMTTTFRTFYGLVINMFMNFQEHKYIFMLYLRSL
jgi:hypothetical protein